MKTTFINNFFFIAVLISIATIIFCSKFVFYALIHNFDLQELIWFLL